MKTDSNNGRNFLPACCCVSTLPNLGEYLKLVDESLVLMEVTLRKSLRSVEDS